MNILTDTLPETITVKGQKYQINTDYRTWIKVSQIVFDNNFDAVSIAKIIALTLSVIPPDATETISELLNFYSCGNKKKNGVKSENRVRQIFDFGIDASYIYAAFMQQYNIDLTKVNFHWWTFKALLDAISDETQFGKILQYRCTDISKIKDKETKRHYRNMKQIYALPDNRTEDEKEREFAEGLSVLF